MAPEKDPVHMDIKNSSTWEFILDFKTGVEKKKPNELTKGFLEKFDQGPVADNIWNFYDRYWLHLIIITNLIWLTFFPLWTWFTFFLYPHYIGQLSGKFSEIWFHKWNKDDHLIFVFLQGSQGWHRSHHETYNDARLGPRPWEYEKSTLSKYYKYLNGQYYIVKFFYEPVEKLKQ